MADSCGRFVCTSSLRPLLECSALGGSLPAVGDPHADRDTQRHNGRPNGQDEEGVQFGRRFAGERLPQRRRSEQQDAGCGDSQVPRYCLKARPINVPFHVMVHPAAQRKEEGTPDQEIPR